MNHFQPSELQKLRDGTASLQDTLQIGAHLRQCAACSDLLQPLFENDAKALAEAFAEDGIDDLPHPDDDELAGLIDGTLDTERRAELERHLTGCHSCRQEWEDLSAFARSIRRRKLHLAVWLPMAATIVVALTLLLARDEQHQATSRPRLSYPQPARPPSSAHSPTPSPVPVEEAPPSRKSSWQALVDETLRTGVLPLHEEVRRFSKGDQYRGATALRGTGISPAGTSIIEQQPALTWQPVENARYEVTVVRSDGTVVETSGALTTPRWKPAAPLSRGELYRWQVRVERGDETSILPAPPAPPALFRILDERTAAELVEARRIHPQDHLLLAVLHARAGVMDETRRQLEQYARSEKRAGRALLAQLPDSNER